MAATTENTGLIRFALGYVEELYREVSQENGAPSPGTQNQVVDYILADPELREAVAEWGRATNPDEATTMPPRRLPIDIAYRRIRKYLEAVMQEPVFRRIEQSR